MERPAAGGRRDGGDGRAGSGDKVQDETNR